VTIQVLTHVHEIVCPHCGKKIYLILGEITTKKEVEERREVTVEEFEAETPMEIKKKLYEWISGFEIGTTFTVAEIREALGFKEYSGSVRGLGNVLHSLVRQGYLKIVDRIRSRDGKPRMVYKVVKKLPF